ncbi:YmL10 [Quaeritorhiza haematococci]|nr:YmL10 [Quaeritorhiza haematococci]
MLFARPLVSALARTGAPALSKCVANASVSAWGSTSTTACASRLSVIRAASTTNGSSLRSPKIAQRPAEYLHLGNVRDNPGAVKKKKRVGRGLQSGKGKTAGRGQKGYKARQSKSRPVPGFEGGQTGILKAPPKMGITARDMKKLATVHLDTLQFWIDRGRIDPNKTITVGELFASGCVPKPKQGIYLGAKGAQFFRSKVNIEVIDASPLAAEAVEERGGKVTCVEYTREELVALMHPDRVAIAPQARV